MNLFKKSTLSVALTGLLGGGAMMGVSTPVEAVNIANDGLGEAMVFPYYTTRAGWSTFFNITNTSAEHTVIMKVRWREAVNSRDARDFNVILSPNDVWTAATVPGTGGAKMVTSDNSCTLPQLPADGSLTGIPFTNGAYVGVNADGGDDRLDRTREGYFEVFQMGTIVNATATGWTGQVARGALHNSVGNNQARPANCNVVRTRLNEALAGTDGLDITDLDEPLNLLKGRAVLINSGDGVAAGYDPLTLANFANTQIYNNPESPLPNLGNTAPQLGTIFNDTTNAVETFAVVNSVADPVSGLISRSGLINDYNFATGSETDWVVTLPTKNFYVDAKQNALDNQAPLPFGFPFSLFPFNAANVGGELFNADNDGLSCFNVNFESYDREEFDFNVPPEQDQFSPFIPGTPVGQEQLCREANIISFGDDSNVFNSRVRSSVSTDGLPAENGWARLSFGNGSASLPVVGMRVEVRNQGDATVNFGFANTHAYERPALVTGAR